MKSRQRGRPNPPSRTYLALGLILFAACSDETMIKDVPDLRAPDSGPAQDAGMLDAGEALDQGMEPDVGPDLDLGSQEDIGATPDAGEPIDSGAVDLGQAPDMGAGCPAPCAGETPLCDVNAGVCVACLSAADCDDSDSCTNETCAQGSCEYAFAGGASCAPTWADRNVMTPGLVWAAGAYDPIANQVIVFGGLDASGAPQSDTWAWDGVTWTLLSPPSSPSARYTHGMAYSPALGRIVLFGGIPEPFDVNALADTWEWDGSTWVETTPAMSPPPRGVHHNMAFDPSSGSLVLFGGGIQPSLPTLNDAWAYDSSGWTPLNPSAVPSARVAACMGTDASRVLMYGGGQWQNPYEGDTWSISAGVFSLLSPTNSPPPLQSSTCAYDGWRDRFVIQGGGLTQVPLTFSSATWEFDGNTWTQVAVGGGPGQSCCAMMATNPGGRGLMMLVNGGTWVLEPPVVP